LFANISTYFQIAQSKWVLEVLILLFLLLKFIKS